MPRTRLALYPIIAIASVLLLVGSASAATPRDLHACFVHHGRGACALGTNGPAGHNLTVRVTNLLTNQTPTIYGWNWDGQMTPSPPAVWPSGKTSFNQTVVIPTTVGKHTLVFFVQYKSSATGRSNTLYVRAT